MIPDIGDTGLGGGRVALPRERPGPERSYAMLWRHLCLVRAWSAAGLTSGLFLLGAQPPAQTSPAEDGRSTAAPVAVVTETVDLLKASKAGDLGVVARGQGQDRVRLSIHNTSAKRLNVVLPPGLVASSAAGQRGGGLQSMGL